MLPFAAVDLIPAEVGFQTFHRMWRILKLAQGWSEKELKENQNHSNALLKTGWATEFPLWLSGLWTQLVYMRRLVQSPASLSGLRIRIAVGVV